MATKTYSLWVKFNGIEKRKRTDDLNETLKSLKPDWLHTEMYVKVKKGDTTSERHLNLVQAKRMFSDDMSREIFINNLHLA